MITAIREVRRAKGMTLEDVARACSPATTAQTIGRLETGTRTVSVAWLNRIAAALGVTAADLVRLPDRADIPVAAVIEAGGAHAPRRPASVVAPAAAPGLIAVTVAAGIGDYRAGDEIWCERLAPEAFATALNRDVLVPKPAGRFVFGRLIGQERDEEGARLQILPFEPRARPQLVTNPPWIARAVRLSRAL
ncbi:helix-turn-helix transcriptional regulator [Sphingomonas sp. H39-1-10]|uniref:helix-turn-helix domain-containing protein n=1 Tax=Sphingomonas TaxID=13687 RepID=UPI00088D5563|nr:MULTISPECIES: helix-turn-helix transcriptional regulator [Sphingomonas]MDF0487970.1 helix-turn-helix transcriptional regulator [Sphingomonas pollutisoli]SDA24216.1 Helix-turn-helix domain-containing protein [Sphingomonas sp. NFR15]